MNRLLLCLLLAQSAFAADPPAPRFDLANATVRAKVYIPDAATGYYRATRFDWSGSIASMTWNGHNYFGEWFPRYDPKINDSITGPVEEFAPLGYAEAAVDETFVKIGVGALRKPAETAYDKFKTYEIADPGRWVVITAQDHIDFNHYLNETNGYAYEYHKAIVLTKNGFVLEHTLRNTGKKAILTDVYEHNFYMLDATPSGPSISVKLPFAAKAAANLRGPIEVRDNQILFQKQLQGRESAQTDVEGFSKNVSDYDLRVENRATGAAVRQTSDRPMSRLLFWANSNTACPEAYIDLRVEPGQETSWRIEYEFYTVPKQ